MIVATLEDLSALLAQDLPPVESWEHSISMHAQWCQYYELMLRFTEPGSPIHQTYAQGLRRERVQLAHALREWETDQKYGCWEGWSLTG